MLSLKFNIIIYKENNEWIAHCLETDLVATNTNRELVEQDMKDILLSHVIFSVENDNLDNLFHPAPLKDWKKMKKFKECELTRIPIRENKRLKSIPMSAEFCFAT